MNTEHLAIDHRYAGWRRGMVLVLVLIVIAMLSLAGYSFSEMMFIERKGARLAGRQLQVRSIVESGAEAVLSYLDQPEEVQETLGNHWNDPALWQAVSISVEPSSGGGRFSVIAAPSPDDETAELRFGLADESARLNLAALMQWDAHEPGRGREALLHLPGMTIEQADAILDWMDADDEPREAGAESEFYERIEGAATPRNSVVGTLEELLLVRGVNRELLFGADANRNGLIDAGEGVASTAPYRTGTPIETHGWWAYLTLSSAEANRDASGLPRINLNGPDLAELHRALVAEFDRPLADFVVHYRQFGPAPAGASGGAATRLPADLSLPGTMTLQSPWDLIGATVAVPAKGTTAMIKSPLSENREAMRQYLPRLLDRLTTTAAPIITGRVNVNEAPRAVLAGVPGIDLTRVDQIVGKRRPGEKDPLARHAAWLVLDEIVDLEGMRSLWPYVTGRGDVYRAQIVGLLDDAQWMERVEIIAAATFRPARLVAWKDLRPVGLGFDPDVLNQDPLDLRR